MKRVQFDWAREWMAIVSDAIGIAYHSHLTTVYDHYYGDKGMSEQMIKQVAVSKLDMFRAIGSLEIVIEIGVKKGAPMDEDKLALSRLKAAFGIKV